MAAPSFIAGNIGADTSTTGFTMGSPTGGTPAQGDWWWCVLNARNNEQLSAALSGWNYVGASPVASDTSSTGISQIFVYYTIQGGSAPSLAVTRGSGPNLCNWGLHVYRPASGYVWDEVNLDYSFQTEASAVTAHSHPSVNANAVDAIISHFIGFAGNGGGSALDATDPSTGSGAGSTANTTDFTSNLWNRRGNQGSSSLMTGGMTLGTGLKVNAGATGACISTQTLSRRHASFVAALSQVKVATLTDAATSGEAGFTGYRLRLATLTEASVSAEALAAMRIRLAAMTEAATTGETMLESTVPFQDIFTGPNGQNLEDRPGWTRVDGSAGMGQISSDALVSTTADASGALYLCADQGSPVTSQYVEFRQVVGNHYSWVAMLATDRDNFLGIRWYGNDIEFYRRVGGTYTAIATIADTYSSSSVVRLEVESAAWRVYVNGSLVSSGSGAGFRSSLSFPGRAGVVMRGQIGDSFDDFRHGLDYGPGASYQNGALTDAATAGEAMTGTRLRRGAVTDAATAAETFAALRVRRAAVTDAATSAEPLNAAKRIRQAAVTDLAQSAEPFNAAKRIRLAAVDDLAQSAETMARSAIKRAALTDAAQSGQSFSVRGWSIVTPTGEVWTPILSTAEVWTVIPSTAETWS